MEKLNDVRMLDSQTLRVDPLNKEEPIKAEVILTMHDNDDLGFEGRIGAELMEESFKYCADAENPEIECVGVDPLVKFGQYIGAKLIELSDAGVLDDKIKKVKIYYN